MSDEPLKLLDLLSDPDRTLQRARSTGAVVATELGPLAVQYEAVRTMLREPKMRPSFSKFLERMGVTSGAFYDWMSRSPLDMEGEEHKRWRALMVRTFTPLSVDRLRPYLRAEAGRLAGELAERGQAEFVQDFARKLPSLGLCELIGVPKEDRDEFGAWADTIGLGFNVAMLLQRISDVDAALSKLLEYSRALVAARRAEPRDDLISRLALAVEEDGVDPELVEGSVAGLVFAGHETTKNQLGWLVLVLSQVPAEWDRVAHEPARAKDVVEEVLRFRSAAGNVSRLAIEDVTLFGTHVPAGTSLLGSLWSANRDALAFPQADAFAVDANREAAQIAFGAGVHHCLGAALARAELQESLIALAARITCPRVEAGAEFLPPMGISGPVTLPITFRARA